MDKWDVPASRPRLRGGDVPRCDMSIRQAMHRIGRLLYFSSFRRTEKGVPFDALKQDPGMVEKFADGAGEILDLLINDFRGWAIVTTPRRRHFGGFHLSTEVCKALADRFGMTFYEGAVQCVNRCRIEPEFHLLRRIPEEKVIIYDDIITTGATLTATADLFLDREMVVCLIGISNR